MHFANELPRYAINISCKQVVSLCSQVAVKMLLGDDQVIRPMCNVRRRSKSGTAVLAACIPIALAIPRIAAIKKGRTIRAALGM